MLEYGEENGDCPSALDPLGRRDKDGNIWIREGSGENEGMPQCLLSKECCFPQAGGPGAMSPSFLHAFPQFDKR